MEIKSMQAKKGDSTNVARVAISGVTDYTDYRGDLTLLDPDTKVAAGLTRVLTPDIDTGFTVGFSPGDTASLAVGSYLVVFEMTKEDTGVAVFRRELSWSLKITESLINI